MKREKESTIDKIVSEKTESKEIIPETKIEKFEKMDFRDDDGKEIKMTEIIKMASEIIPENLRWQNVKKIEYTEEKKGLGNEYGIKGLSAGGYHPYEKIIRFTKTNHTKEEMIDRFFHILAHEWAHSIDPHVVQQRNMSLQKKSDVALEFARIRNKEKCPFSYVKKINNENKQIEEDIKKEEDFAESMAYTLENPLFIKLVAPKRYEFCVNSIKQRFPDFDFEKSDQKRGEYLNFLYNLNIKA